MESIDLENWIKENLVDFVPMSIAAIDREFNVVYANRSFERKFGSWQSQKCFSVYKNRDTVCHNCKGAEAFEDGIARINKEVGYDKDGQLTYYIKNTIPRGRLPKETATAAES